MSFLRWTFVSAPVEAFAERMILRKKKDQQIFIKKFNFYELIKSFRRRKTIFHKKNNKPF